MSNNKCNAYSAIFANPSESSQSLTFSLNFSSIANNTATTYGCIQLNNQNALYCIGTSNIINNEQGSIGTEATLYSTGKLKIVDSCLIGNNATFTVKDVYSKGITFDNCSIDFGKGSSGASGSILFISTATKLFVNRIKLFSKGFCAAGYDSVKGVSNNVKMNQKQKCFTCKHKSNSVGISFAFILTFLITST